MERYVELKKKNIIFAGDTEQEKKANELIYDLCLENDALQQKNELLKDDNIKMYQKLSFIHNRTTGSDGIRHNEDFRYIFKEINSLSEV